MGGVSFDLGLGGFGPQLLVGAGLSLKLWLASLVLGTCFGLLAALSRLSGSRILRRLAGLYINVTRGIPELLVVFLLYYCGSATLSWIVGEYVELSAFAAGTFALALVFGAYTAEIFRGGILAVPHGQTEASQALGLGKLGAFALVILPQAWRHALPSFGSQCIILVKQTSLVSVIGLEELMRKGKIAVNSTNEPFIFYMTIGAIYLAITLILTVVLRLAERRASRSLAGA